MMQANHSLYHFYRLVSGAPQKLNVHVRIESFRTSLWPNMSIKQRSAILSPLCALPVSGSSITLRASFHPTELATIFDETVSYYRYIRALEKEAEALMEFASIPETSSNHDRPQESAITSKLHDALQLCKSTTCHNYSKGIYSFAQACGLLPIIRDTMGVLDDT